MRKHKTNTQIHTDTHTSKHTQTKKQHPWKHKIVIHSTQVKDHLDQEKNDEKIDMRQKNLQKVHWIKICSSPTMWNETPLLSVAHLPTETSSEKTELSFTNSCQLERVSWFVIDFTLSELGPYLAWTFIALCAWFQKSFWVQTCFSPVVSERHSFLGVFTPCDSYNIYASSSVGFSDCSKKKLLKPSNENWVFQSISLSVHCPASSWWEKYC